jgi:hypothetical protein
MRDTVTADTSSSRAISSPLRRCRPQRLDLRTLLSFDRQWTRMQTAAAILQLVALAETAPSFVYRSLGQAHELGHLGHTLAPYKRWIKTARPFGVIRACLSMIAPLADGSWLFGGISFALRPEGNNFLKPHS